MSVDTHDLPDAHDRTHQLAIETTLQDQILVTVLQSHTRDAVYGLTEPSNGRESEMPEIRTGTFDFLGLSAGTFAPIYFRAVL